MGSPSSTLAGWAAITVVLVGLAWFGLEPLPLGATALYAVPPFFMGLYLAVSATWIRDLGLYGSVARGWPNPMHVVAQGLGCSLTGLAVWLVLALPPAGSGAVAAGIPALDERCVGPAEVRLDREVLTAAEALLALRANQGSGVQRDIDAALLRVMARCVEQARVAFVDPRGTHRSWRVLRTWLAEHPEQSPLGEGDPLWTAPWNERVPEPSRPVPVLLE